MKCDFTVREEWLQSTNSDCAVH